MSSEIKVDTISENTSGNGVAIDGLTIKDGGITATTGATVFNEGSADIDFRIESNDKTNMFFVDAGNNKIGINTTGSSPSQVTIEDVTGNGGGTLGLTTDTSGTSDNLGRFHFGNATDGSLAAIFGIADGASDAGALTFRTEATGAALEEALRIDSNRKLATNGETASDTGEGGLCLNQAANDNSILTFKSSDIAHGITDAAQTDTFAKFTKEASGEGGLIMQCFTEGAGSEAFKVIGYVGGTSFNTGKATSGHAIIELAAAGSDGSTGDGDVGSNGNLLCIQNRNTARFFFDAEGDFHADSSSTTFDEYDDAQLARTFDITHGRGVIKSKFDKFISYNHEKLAELQLVGREDDGTPNHFINVTGMQRLHNGAIWQQYEKHQRLAEAVYEMAKEALGEDKADAILEKHDIKLLN
jgi:hypothetical protein